jgi:Na+/proline symporter
MDQAPPSPTGPATAGPASQPLTPEQLQQITRANQQRKKLRRASGVANFNAWSFAILAGLSVLFAVFSPGSLIAAVLLAALAWNEFRGRKQLRRLDPRGPSTLGWNQVVFCLIIAGYCGIKLYQATTGPGTYAKVIEENPELANMLEPMQELIQMMEIATYLIVLVLGAGLQGLTAWYYFTRRRWLNDYIEKTPQWVRDLDRVQAETA